MTPQTLAQPMLYAVYVLRCAQIGNRDMWLAHTRTLMHRTSRCRLDRHSASAGLVLIMFRPILSFESEAREAFRKARFRR